MSEENREETEELANEKKRGCRRKKNQN